MLCAIVIDMIESKETFIEFYAAASAYTTIVVETLFLYTAVVVAVLCRAFAAKCLT